MKEFVFPGWEIVEQIGSGGFSKVYKIKKSDNSNNGFYSALKVIHIPNTSEEIDSYRSEGYDDNSITQIFDEQVKSIVQEFELMHRFRGVTNIVSYEDHLVMQNENGIGWTILIRMELLKTLPDYYKTRVIKDNDVKQLGIDICKALKLCEQKNIVHRDIKPQNIFANDFDDFKLGDFGVARVMEHTTRATKIGTYSYMAPEVYNGKSYNYISDIYSLGMVLYWLLNERRLPFLPLPPAVPTPSVNNEAQARRLSGEPLPAPKYGSEELKQVVLKACAFDPAERYSSAAEFMAALQNAACAGEVCNPSVAATVLPDGDKTVFIGTNAVNGTASGPETPADDDKTVSIFSAMPMSDFPKSEPASAPTKEETFQAPPVIQPAEEKAEEPAVSVAVDSDDDRTVAFFEEAAVVEATIKTAQPMEETKKDIPADKAEAEPITGPKEPVEKKSKKGLVFGVAAIAAIAAIIIVIILLLTNRNGNNTYGDYTSRNSFEESSDINIENSSEDASSKDDTISEDDNSLEENDNSDENNSSLLEISDTPDVSEDNSVAPHTHSYGGWISNETSHWTACDCGEKNQLQAHNFGEWNVISNATETANGRKERGCVTCGYKETATIPVLSHTHSYSSSWKTNETSHWKICDCGEKRDLTSHTYGSWSTTKAATCKETGTKQRSCTVCGHEETVTISVTGDHSYGSWTTTKSATCVENGSKKRTCTVCGKTESQSVSATGHNWIEATYTDPKTCSRCYATVGQPLKAVLTELSIYSMPKTTEYYVGESFDPTGLTLFARYSDGSAFVIDDTGYTYDTTVLYNTGTQYVTVSWDGKSISIAIEVSAPLIELSFYSTEWHQSCYPSRWDTYSNLPIWILDCLPDVTVHGVNGDVYVGWDVVASSSENAYVANGNLYVNTVGKSYLRAYINVCGNYYYSEYCVIDFKMHKTMDATNIIRSEPNKNSSALGSIPAGDFVYFTEIYWDPYVRDAQGQYFIWGKATYNGVNGWVVIS